MMKGIFSKQNLLLLLVSTAVSLLLAEGLLRLISP
jgi:hypothetical protein